MIGQSSLRLLLTGLILNSFVHSQKVSLNLSLNLLGKKSSSKFAVQVQQDSSAKALDPCHKYTSEPCTCSITPSCDYDDLTLKCITEAPKFSDKLSCRRNETYYAYGGNIICKSTEDSGDCTSGRSVHAVNLNGLSFQDKSNNGTRYRANSEVLTIDREKLNLQLTSACLAVKGVSSPEMSSKLYGTIVEGKPPTAETQNYCIGYPVPILQDGEFELTVKNIAQPNKCFKIKLGSVVGAENIDLYRLSESKGCKAVDIVFLFLVENSGTVMYIKGHQNSVPISGGFSLKLCYGCTGQPHAVYRASSFSLVRFGEDTRKFENMKLIVIAKKDGSEKFKIQEIPDDTLAQTAQPSQSPSPPKDPCTSVADSRPAECKKAGCEYNVVSGRCYNAKCACADALMGSADCIRENATYVTGGGFLCKAGLVEEDRCRISEVKSAVYFNQQKEFPGDMRGVRYERYRGSDSEQAAETPDYEIANLTTSSESKCTDKKSGRVKIVGRRKLEWPLYEVMMFGKATVKECFSYTIGNVTEGSYELVIKTVEPFFFESGKRAFNIRLNEQLIVANLDVVQYAGSCTGMDLIVPLSVGMEDVTVNGFSPISMTDNKVTVSFCPGSGDGVYEYTNFVVAALYLARLKKDSEIPEEVTSSDTENPKEGKETGKEDSCPACKLLHGKPKNCKKAGYEYDPFEKKCVQMKPDCSEMFSRSMESFCRRSNVFYVNSGVLCKNSEDAGSCEKSTPLYAVNLGSDQEYRDSLRHISYKPEGKRGTDPEGIGERGTLEGKCSVEGNGISPEEGTQLYSSFVTGKKAGIEPVCISYTIPICQPGWYELSLKMTQFQQTPNQSCFDIRIAEDTSALISVDVARLSSGKSCEPIEVVFPLYVKQLAPGMPKTRYLILPTRGGKHTNEIEIEDRLDLKFCSCDWSMPDPDFRVSAFSLVRFGEGSVPCDVCHLHAGDESGCADAKEGCTFDKNSQKCLDSNQATPEDPCGQHDNNGNACRWEGCDYNLFSGSCTKSIQECSNGTFPFIMRCNRAGPYYAKVGVLCKSSLDSGLEFCQRRVTTWAVNLNGDEVTKGDGITYVKEDGSFSVATSKQVRSTTTTGDAICDITDPEEKALWGTHAEGFMWGEGCLTYAIPLCENGDYELSLLMMDKIYKRMNARCFDVKINSITVLHSLDLASYGECAKSEIVILFAMRQSHLFVLGQQMESSIAVNRKFFLSFCFGGCGYADGRFVVSAFSLVRFGHTKAKKCDKCAIYDEDQTTCEKKDCEFDVATKKCSIGDKRFIKELRRRDSEDDGPCNCDANGFRYNPETGNCTAMSPAFENKLSCRRARVHYAITKNHFCRSNGNLGDCAKGDTVYGVNLNGEDHFDANGLKFRKESAGMSIDPQEVRVSGMYMERCKMKDIQNRDEFKLYRKFVAGDFVKGKRFPGTVLSYPVPLLQDGEYELTLKFMNRIGPFFNRTSFQISINDVVVASDFDLYEMGGRRACSGIDIAILFLVEDSMKLLRVRGQNMAIPISNGFHLQFGYGSWKGANIQLFFLVSAFAVFRFGDDTEVPDVMRSFTMISEGDERCNTYSELGPCPCVMNDCRYDMFSRKCVAQNKAWNNRLSCRRAGYFYTFGSHVICKVEEQQWGCSSWRTIYAINLGGRLRVDRLGIHYQEERKNLMSGNVKIRVKGESRVACHVAGVVNEDEETLYGTYVYGNPAFRNGGDCIGYAIKIAQDGQYELIIKFVEDIWPMLNARNFDIKINDHSVVVNLDLVKLADGRNCMALDLIVLFLVENGATSLRLKGVTTPLQITGGFQLNFCYASSFVRDTSFRVSAFAVLRHGRGTKDSSVQHVSTDPSLLDIGGLIGSVLGSIGTLLENGAAEENVENSEVRCSVHKRDAVTCKRSGCEYDLFRRECVSGVEECKNEKMFVEHGKCRRLNAFYGVGGVLCQNRVAKEYPECAGVWSGYGIAINERLRWQKRNITYIDETRSSYRDYTGVRRSDAVKSWECPVDNSYSPRYFQYGIIGDTEKGKGPLIYLLPVSGDGNYELSTWHLEDVWKSPNKRSFDISLNSVVVLFGIDLSRLSRGAPCPVELVFLLKVQNNGTQVEVVGFPTPIPVYGGQLELGFHFGSLGTEDVSFKFSIFSFIKFQEVDPAQEAEANMASLLSELKGVPTAN